MSGPGADLRGARVLVIGAGICPLKDACGIRSILPGPQGRGVSRIGSIRLSAPAAAKRLQRATPASAKAMQ
ncbi:MAG: hypothetical protein HIU89_09180 [Proteobacteria bacterium]|nr:hypothetical protein [Pseudomonadota bacterium]